MGTFVTFSTTWSSSDMKGVCILSGSYSVFSFDSVSNQCMGAIYIYV